MANLTNTLEINHSYILDRIREKLDIDLLEFDHPYDMLTITINKERIIDLLLFLRDDEILKFDFLTDICGIHYPQRHGEEIGVIYHMHSMINNIRLRIKTFASIENPTFLTVTPVFAAANWMERETYDFYGAIFEGHPNLRRILNMDEMHYFPMRKEYPLQDATRTDKQDKYFGR